MLNFIILFNTLLNFILHVQFSEPLQLFQFFDPLDEFIFIWPEFSFISLLTLIIFISVFRSSKIVINEIFGLLYLLMFYIIGINFAILSETLLNFNSTENLLLFNNTLIINPSGVIFKLFISFFFLVYLLTFDEFVDNQTSTDVQILQLFISQFILFFCFCLVLSINLFATFVCLESITFSICGLLVVTRNLPQITEVIVKYFLFNVTTTSLLMYGFSEMFRVTQSLNYWDIHYFFLINYENFEFLSFWVVFCLATILGSFLFKLNLAPFHFWSIEVYGHMQISTLFLILFPIKISLFVNFTLLLNSAFSTLSNFWQPVLFLLGIISIALGTLGSLYQDQLKQFLVYSSVVQTGFLILGLSTNTVFGISASFLHLFNYALTGTGIFVFLVRFVILDLNINLMYLNQLRHIKLSSCSLGFYFLIFSFAGLPPFFGFFTKFNLLISLFSCGYVITTFFILICNILSVIYYLNLLRDAFFGDSFLLIQNGTISNFREVSLLRHTYYIIVVLTLILSLEINWLTEFFSILVEGWIFF